MQDQATAQAQGSNTAQPPAPDEAVWFYESAGERKGGISQAEIVCMITGGLLPRGTAVWRKGFPDWMKVDSTELNTHFGVECPPPLSGEHVNNTLVWVLAFAPFLGYLLECFIAGMFISSTNRALDAVGDGKFFFVTVALNIALSFYDEKKLKLAGHNTDKFSGMVWLVPVYLFQRAKALNQNMAYFIVWMVTFFMVLLGV